MQAILRAYQRWISPSLPPSCRYAPTCSQYAIDALEQRGLLVGTGLAIWRVLRCHPFVKGGVDPVPNKDVRLSRAGASRRTQILHSAKTNAPRSG